jgi:hypothetical protein
MENEKVKDYVKERYGKIAKNSKSCSFSFLRTSTS